LKWEGKKKGLPQQNESYNSKGKKNNSRSVNNKREGIKVKGRKGFS
jgi:hypothetical protein